MRDYHVHTNYSDGSFLYNMVAAAADAGLDGVGIADHCVVSERDGPRGQRRRLGFPLDEVYERRRAAIADVREWFGIDIYDAVEMDYDPRDETEIRAFLDEAGFDYAVGSVHWIDGVNVHAERYFADCSERERRAAVDEYFEKLVALVESELFEVAAHLDLVERNPPLQGCATEDHYRAVAGALADSRTVPELNAGRVLDDYGRFHPHPDFLSVLREYDVPLTVGSDSHEPGEIGPRVDRIGSFLAERGIEPVDVDVEAAGRV
ncbi:histidinol-phosphatase [Halobacteriales archaeon QS_1_68_17]|nr:MAG: histidinol-phosphatase [Halobacteriales archaeon QS_1_68_17]